MAQRKPNPVYLDELRAAIGLSREKLRDLCLAQWVDTPSTQTIENWLRDMTPLPAKWERRFIEVMNPLLPEISQIPPPPPLYLVTGEGDDSDPDLTVNSEVASDDSAYLPVAV